MREILKKIKNITDKIAEDHISAYAAQSAFFIMLSLVPILLLLMTLVRFTPITQADIMAAAYELFPKTVSSTMSMVMLWLAFLGKPKALCLKLLNF